MRSEPRFPFQNRRIGCACRFQIRRTVHAYIFRASLQEQKKLINIASGERRCLAAGIPAGGERR